MDYATFTSVFTEFSSASVYPQVQVEFWLAQAPLQLNAERLGANYDLAVMLYAAHNLVLSAKDAKAAAFGGVSGGASGVTSSKTVDKVTVSYDTGSSTIDGAGAWNLTTYGTRLYQLLRGANTGPFYVANRRSRIS